MDQKTLQRLVSFRKEIHQYPQASFQEFETRKRIRSILNEFGVKDSWMTEMAKTALVVDLTGEAEAEGQKRCIAFRADMDALTMVENNHHLAYRSKNQGVAHMCGHDGHITCLVGFVTHYMKQLPTIPKNKTIRLFFQPSEQGPLSGAKLMIEQGCMEGVDEVYGFHQWPTAPVGELWCQQGPVMSEITKIKIKVIGTGGHGSQPENLKVAIWEGMWLYQQIKSYIDQLHKQKSKEFTSTFPIFQAGERCNVISDSAYMEGTIRSFEQGLSSKITSKIETFLQETKSRGFQIQHSFDIIAPININTKTESDHVLRVGQKLFGKEKVGKGKLPFKASEDFAFFTQVKPGAFFFFSAAHDNDANPPMLHNSNLDFNDKLIPFAAKFWMELALDRIK